MALPAARNGSLPTPPGAKNRAALTALLPVALMVAATLAGCTNPLSNPAPAVNYTDLPGYGRDTTGKDPSAWPQLPNATLTILDNGAFQYVFGDAAKQFQKLTGIKVKLEDGGDTLDSLGKLDKAHASGKYDLIWGVDNMVYATAVRQHDLVAYKPRLADRINPDLKFFGDAGNASWYATPADHGYIGVNVDGKAPALANASAIGSLSKLAFYADQFVTEDPAKSSPGLGFLLVTIAAYGENPAYSNARYDWKSYWTDLFRGPDRNHDGKSDGCVLVAANWSEAYEQHFSAPGTWVGDSTARDKPIVVSYSQSPASEANTIGDKAATPLVANGTTYHQIQTIAIANGTKNLQAAQAWVEFTLTDYFQDLAPSDDVMYPAVPTVAYNTTFHGKDPAPGSFQSVQMPPGYVDANLPRWQAAWSSLREDPDVNCKLG